MDLCTGLFIGVDTTKGIIEGVMQNIIFKYECALGEQCAVTVNGHRIG